MTPQHTRNGATLLITVLIVGTVALVVGMGLILRVIGELDIARTSNEAQQSLATADSCLQEVLLGLWGDKTYAREGKILVFDRGECTVSMERDKEGRSISLTARVGGLTRRIQAVVDPDQPQLRLLKWQWEVPGS